MNHPKARSLTHSQGCAKGVTLALRGETALECSNRAYEKEKAIMLDSY
jgi:hypothetical protein